MDYNDLMAAVDARSELEVAKILDKLTEEELSDLSYNTTRLKLLISATVRSKFLKDSKPCRRKHCSVCGT